MREAADRPLPEEINEKAKQLIAGWPLPDAWLSRLFTATRNPPQFVVFNTDTGKVVTTLPCVGVNSDMWFDAASRRIYVTGSGTASIFEQRDPDHYAEIAEVPKAYRAKSSIFVSELKRLYVAASGKGKPDAKLQVLIYEVQ